MSSNHCDLENQLLGYDFKIGKRLGSGSFGEIRFGVNMATGEIVAIKIESKKSNCPTLKLEYQYYKQLGLAIGLPKIYGFGPVKHHFALAMELLGPSLYDLHEMCDFEFSLKTTILIAIQMITRIEFVHSRNLVYRDIKPENFLVGKQGTREKNLIYIVDFGLAKKYINHKTRRHIPMVDGKSLTGTARYMSVNCHHGLELSRRDDIESLGYVFIYFLRGSLPWQGIKARTTMKKFRKIKKTKTNMKIDQLVEDLPIEFGQIISYAKGLGFTDEPDYDYLRNLLYNLFDLRKFKMDEVYDWSSKIEALGLNSLAHFDSNSTNKLKDKLHDY